GGLEGLRPDHDLAAQIGNVGATTRVTPFDDDAITSSGIIIYAGGDLNFTGGDGYVAYAQIGDGGGRSVDGNLSTVIGIGDAGDLNFRAGNGEGSYVQLGTGGWSADGDFSGDIFFREVGDLNFEAGASDRSFALLGNGGFLADGTHEGDIIIGSAGNLTFTGGAGIESFARLGHGNSASGNTRSTEIGDIMIQSAKDFRFTAGSGVGSEAHLGHGGRAFEDGDITGNIYLGQVGDLDFIASDSSFAALGHVRPVFFWPGMEVTGQIQIEDAGNLRFVSGDAGFGVGFQARGFATLGHRIFGSAEGEIALNQVGAVDLISNGNEARIGHMSLSGLSSTGNISIDASGSLNLVGSGPVQIGHKSPSRGDSTGNITLNTNRSLALQSDVEALIGHGDANSSSDLSGDVSVRVLASADIRNGIIGHRVGQSGANTSTYLNGDTFIGVGSFGGSGHTLSADAASSFQSAPGGQLRFYLSGSGANRIAAGADLNGTAAAGPGITPNNQGVFPFGEGPYDLTDPGNFAFYTLLPNTPDPIATKVQQPNFGSIISGNFGLSEINESLGGDLFSIQSLIDRYNNPGNEFKLIQPVEDQFEFRLNDYLLRLGIETKGSVPLGATPFLYQTKETQQLLVGVENGLLQNGASDRIIPQTITSMLGATVTLGTAGSFTYDPTTSNILATLKPGESMLDYFVYRLLDENGELIGLGTVAVLVIGEDDEDE
ncbi:MAG: hypothetical protein AAF585_17055, partial [Verrucomicrobiota bacterium]